MQQLTDVPQEIFESAREEYVNIVDLSKNRLTTLPEGLVFINFIFWQNSLKQKIQKEIIK